MSPSEIVSKAAAIGLDAIAITDHDTLSGIPEAIDTGAKLGIQTIVGLEISAVYNPGTMHILGYFKTFPAGLEKNLEFVQEGRRRRFPRIIEKLNKLGLAVTIDDVATIANGAQIGRPHIAKALINKGYVPDLETAFSQYLAKGRPAYVEKDKMTAEDALSLICTYGGLPVLAHPFTLELQSHELNLLIAKLKDRGLKGVEVNYPEHSKAQKKLYASIAHDLDLFITGGTDYHGPGRNSISIGDFGVDRKLLDIMLSHFNHG